MTTIYLYSFASVIVVSLISLVGVFTLSLKEKFMRKYIFVFISVAVGALLGDAFIHLIPEAFEISNNQILTSIFIIAGIFFFFSLEKFLHWHHHGEDEGETSVHPMGKLLLVSDGVHNFIDGVVIGASFLVSVPVGIATSIAVILHEIPQEIGDFAVLMHSGYSKGRALFLNFLSGIFSVFGLVFLFTIQNVSEIAEFVFLPLAAGGFIYIALADLIPELHKTKEVRHSLLQLFSVIVGVLFMVGLLWLE
ncbi:MAG: ZIP family metal transporter [Patescibacteria group bacterium]